MIIRFQKSKSKKYEFLVMFPISSLAVPSYRHNVLRRTVICRLACKHVFCLFMQRDC